MGYLLSTWMTIAYEEYFEFPRLASNVYPYTHAIGIGVSVACAAAGSLNGVLSVLRLQPAEAMRPAPPQRGGAILLERIAPLWNLLSAPWRVALRSIFRRRLRTGAGLFASTMGAGLLVTGFMFMESMNYFMKFQFDLVSKSDIEITFADEGGWQTLEDVGHMPGVDLAEPVMNVACTFQSGPYRRKSGITGLLPDSRLTIPRDRAGRRIALPARGLVLSRTLANKLHVAVGDRVTVTPVRGSRRPMELTIVKIADSFMGEQTYADIRYLSNELGEEFAINGAQLLIDPSQSAALYRELKNSPNVQGIGSRHDQMESLSPRSRTGSANSSNSLRLASGVTVS